MTDKAIRAAKLTAAGILDKARARVAIDRAGGQIAPSKYLPDVPRQVHAAGGKAIPGGYTIKVVPEKLGVLARFKGRNVGQLTLSRDNGKLTAFQMAVHPDHQRKGLMSAMHDAAEEAFGKIEPDATLTDQGFDFWKGYRPDAVSDNLRFHRDRLMGQTVKTPYGPGTVQSVGRNGMNAMLENGNTGWAKASDNEDVLRAAGIDPSTIKYAAGGRTGMAYGGGYVPMNFTQPQQQLAIARVARPAPQQQGPSTMDSLAQLAEIAYGKPPAKTPVEPQAARAEAGSQPFSQNKAMSMAKSQLGLSEGGQRAAIKDYLTTGGANLDPATTAWCAAFVNSTLKQSGVEGTGSNMARSFLDWGQPVEKPQEGDIAVFSRGDPNGPYGHVGFFNGYDENGNILVLGGNQGDAVSVSPYSPDSLLGFRRAYASGGKISMFEGIHPDLQDEQGNPVDLWHGTPGQPFNEFDDSKIGRRDPGFYGRGHYLTAQRGNAEAYADPEEMRRGSVMGPLHAALKNPFIWDASSPEGLHRTMRKLQDFGVMGGKDRLDPWDALKPHEIDQFMKSATANGHDGVIRKTGRGLSEIVVFKPSMIKHRDAERFDPNDPNIYHARGGVAK